MLCNLYSELHSFTPTSKAHPYQSSSRPSWSRQAGSLVAHTPSQLRYSPTDAFSRSAVRSTPHSLPSQSAVRSTPHILPPTCSLRSTATFHNLAYPSPAPQPHLREKPQSTCSVVSFYRKQNARSLREMCRPPSTQTRLEPFVGARVAHE